jgi:hypothetical protein
VASLRRKIDRPFGTSSLETVRGVGYRLREPAPLIMARTQLPLRLRLTLAFALCMAVVLAALGVFLRVRLGDELLRGIDLDLRARAAAITTTLSRTGAAGISDRDPVLDPDEAFAQVLRPDGTIVRTTSAVRGHPLLPPDSLAGVGTGQVRTTRVPASRTPLGSSPLPCRPPPGRSWWWSEPIWATGTRRCAGCNGSWSSAA